MAEQVDVLKSGLVSVHKFDFQPSGFDNSVTERQIHHARHPFALAVRLPVLRYQPEVLQFLHDITVPDIGIRHLAVSSYLGMSVRLRSVRTAEMCIRDSHTAVSLYAIAGGQLHTVRDGQPVLHRFQFISLVQRCRTLVELGTQRRYIAVLHLLQVVPCLLYTSLLPA